MKTTHYMKTKIYAFVLIFLMTFSINAQIDRSKQPTPGPAPKIALKSPDTFTLKNGLKVMVVENHKLPRVALSLTIDNKPVVEGDKAGVSQILGAMLGNGTKTIDKDAFNDEVDFLGASISFGATGGSARSLSKYTDRIIELMADAALNPLLVEEEFLKEKEKLIEGLKSSEKSVDAIAARVRGALSYGKQHPYGEYVSEETVQNVTFGDVLAFYEKYFNPNNAYLVIVGDVNFKDMKKQIEKRFNPWKKSMDFSIDVPQAAPNAQYTQINFIDMPNAVQSNITLTNNVDLKMNHPDYHAVLIANKILGGGFGSYLNMNLREKHGYTYGARSNIRADKYISNFSASTAVRNAVTDSAVVETLKEINRIKTTMVDPAELENAKAKYVGDFVLALEQPTTIARYALNIKINDLPKDFYETYLQKINAVTAEDVKRVANKYFKPENSRIVVVGKGSEVAENLEKTGVPVFYFDTYANPISKPSYSKPIPAGVTATTVMDAYINAVGGKDKLKAVKSVVIVSDVTIEGMPFAPKAEIKSMVPNKESMEMSVEGMGVLMKEKFNGTTGYREQQGMKMEMTEEENKAKALEQTIFPELSYSTDAIALESLTSINGKDVYKVKVTTGKTETFRYYDVVSGFLVRAEATVEAGGQTMTTSVNYDNYSPVKGIQFPYKFEIEAGPQVLSFNTTNIKINEDVSDADFK